MRLQTDKASGKRLSVRAVSIASGLALLVTPLVTFAMPAAAASSFSDHLWKFVSGATNTIDFNKGGSKIYENGNLTLQTDNQLDLIAPTKVVASHDLAVSNQLLLWRNGVNIGGSKIYENTQMHIATDDKMYLDAPMFVQVSNDLNVGGDLNVDGVLSGDGSGLTNLNVTVENLNDLILDGANTAFTGNMLVGGDQWSHNSFAVQDPDESYLFNVDNTCDGNGYSCVSIGQGGDGGEFDINTDNTYIGGNLDTYGDTGLWGDVNLGSDSDNSVYVNGRLYGWDGDPVTVGHHSDTSGFKVWGNTDLRGDLSVGGWGTNDSSDVAFSVESNCGYDGDGGCITLGGDNYNAEVTVNGRLLGGSGYAVTIGHHFDAGNADNGLLVWGYSKLAYGAQVGMPFDNQDLTVYGDAYLEDGHSLYFNDGQWQQYVNGDTQNFVLYNSNSDTDVFQVAENGDTTITGESRHAMLDLANDGDLYVEGNSTLGTSKWDSVVVNGRLYGEEGGPVTVGRYTSENDFKVWGNTDLRGDLSVGGWGTSGDGPVFTVQTDCTYDDGATPAGCITLGGDQSGVTNSQALIFVNGRLYGASDGEGGYLPVTIGHHFDAENSGLLVWGHSSLAGGASVGMPFDNQDLTVYGNITMDGASRHALLDLSNDGDLNVEGNTTLGSSSWDELDVNAEAYFNAYTEFENEVDFYDNVYLEDGSLNADGGDINVNNGYNININDGGDLSVSGSASFGSATVDNLVVNNSTTWGGTVTYNGTTTFNGASTYNSSATFNGVLTGGTANLSGTFTVTGAPVNFSGASSMRVPVTAAAYVDNTTVCSTTGQVAFSTNDSHFYGCDGAHWQILD